MIAKNIDTLVQYKAIGDSNVPGYGTPPPPFHWSVEERFTTMNDDGAVWVLAVGRTVPGKNLWRRSF